MPSLLYIVNVDWFFLSHRLPLAKAALEHGFEVHLATQFIQDKETCQRYGLQCHSLEITRSDRSPWREMRCFFSILKKLKTLKPDLVHLVTIKPVIYGGIAARFLGIRAVAAIPGLGHTFTEGNFWHGIFRQSMTALYRLALGGPRCHVIVQNSEDRAFVNKVLRIPSERITLIPGSGVDLDAYPVTPEPEGPPVVAMASRLLFDKGVREFIEAARIVKEKRPEVRFVLAGDPDPGNPSSLSFQDVEQLRQEGLVEVVGYQKDMADFFSKVHIVALPSYREGLPKVLIEAAACGRAVVTTDVPGCRDAIIPGETGLLVKARDANGLSEGILDLLSKIKHREEMGQQGRSLAKNKFDINQVIKAHCAIYRFGLS